VISLKIIFMGTPDFSVPLLDMLIKEDYMVSAVVTRSDKPKGRGKKILPSPVKLCAIKNNIEVLQPEDIISPEFFEKLSMLSPDLIITAAYGKILPENILELPRMGCINVHASLLPKYRGAAPIQRALMNGEKTSGITTMFMDKGMDTGDILLKQAVNIDDDMTAGELHDKLAYLGTDVLKKTLEKLKKGTLKHIPQNNDEASYAPMIKKSEGEIRWNSSPQTIHNIVRGLNPWPCAFTYLKGRRMKILKTGKIAMKNTDREGTTAVPGTILKTAENGMVIACMGGTLNILEIHFNAGRKMNISECWHNFNEGEVLGK
jgi:methionyl-tRNA formyltransferase